MVIVFAEGIFKGETHVVHPPTSKLSPHLSVPLYPPKDRPVDIHIKVSILTKYYHFTYFINLKALVGHPNSIQYHVFEITRQLPRFSMYSLIQNQPSKSESFVEFKINERLQRICMWVNQNFLLPEETEIEAGPELRLHLKCLRDGTDLLMIFEISGKVMFYTENMLLASDLVQSLAVFLNLDTLEVWH